MYLVLIYSDYAKVSEKAARLNPHGAAQMENTVAAVQKALEQKGHRVTALPATPSLLEDILKLSPAPDLLFCLAAGIFNKAQQANVVGMLEMLPIPQVGSSLYTHVVGLHKATTKALLRAKGIPTAASQTFHTADEPLDAGLLFPLLVKPEHEGSSMGVEESSFVENEQQLRRQVRHILEQYNQPALAEEFVPGREFTVGIIGNREPRALPLKEFVFSKELAHPFISVGLKAADAVTHVCPAEVEEGLRQKIEAAAIGAFKALECRGFARVDIRLDAAGEPKVLELNTLPGLQPDYSDFPTAAAKAGIAYEDLIEQLVLLALEG